MPGASGEHQTPLLCLRSVAHCLLDSRLPLGHDDVQSGGGALCPHIPRIRDGGLRVQSEPGTSHTSHAPLRLLRGAPDVPGQLPLLHPQLCLRHSLLRQPFHWSEIIFQVEREIFNNYILYSGIITTVTTFVLENFDDEELKYIGSICRQVFLIFPHYCLGRGLMDMATEEGLNAVVGVFGECSVLSLGEFIMVVVML